MYKHLTNRPWLVFLLLFAVTGGLATAGCNYQDYPRDKITEEFAQLKSLEQKQKGLPYWPRLSRNKISRKNFGHNPNSLRNFEANPRYLKEKQKDLEAIVKEGITLKELLTFALKHSNSMVDALADFELAKRNYLWSRYKFMPKPKLIAGMTSDVDLTEYYQKIDTAVKETFKYGTELKLGISITGSQYFNTDDPNEYETTAGLTITQPLLRGRYNITYYDDWVKYRDAMRGLVKVREELILDIASRFYGLARLQNSLKIARDSYERNKTLLEKYEARLKMGKVAEADVESIRIQVQRARNQMLALQDNINERRRDFNYDAGMPKKSRVQLTVPELKFEPMNIDSDKTYNIALKMRVDYLSIRDKLEDLIDKRRKVKNDLLPQFNLFFGYGYRKKDRDLGVALRQLGKPQWEAGFTFEYDFNRRSLRIALSEVSEKTRRIRRDYFNKKEKLGEEIDDFIRALERLKRDVAVSKKTLDLKKRELERDLDLFEKGKISNDEVVRKEDEYNSERNSYIRLLTEYELMKYRYLKVKGTLGR